MASRTHFDRAIDAAPTDVPGQYTATIDAEWSAPRGANGGYVAAIVVRALHQEIADPTRPVRTLTLHYLRPPQPGTMTVDVVLERVGRTMTTATIRLTQHEKLMVVAVATCAGPRTGPLSFSERPAALPDPFPPIDEVPVFEMPPGVPEIAHRFRFRPLRGPMVMSGSDEARLGGWTSLTESRGIDAEYLAATTDVWVPACFTRATELVGVPTVELTIHFRHIPEPGENADVLCLFTSNTADEGFVEEDGWVFSADGRLLAQSRQLSILMALSS